MKFFRKKGAFLSLPKFSPQLMTPEMSVTFATEDRAYEIENVSNLNAIGLSKALMLYRHRPIASDLDAVGRACSMLHLDVLVLIYFLAMRAVGNLLEIGPCLGGSTIALAWGMRAGLQQTENLDGLKPSSSEGIAPPEKARAFVTVEKGGKVRSRRLASSDIVADLRKNLVRFGANDLAQLVVGGAVEPATIELVRQKFAADSVGLLMIDADGAVQATLDAYRAFLQDRCWVVIDDYYSNTTRGMEKAARSKKEIDSLGASGELETLGLFGWGTWIGRWHRQPNELLA